MTAINLIDSDMSVMEKETSLADRKSSGDLGNIDKQCANSSEQEKMEEKPLVEKKKEPAEKPKRLVSLDAFRGLTIVGMLLVNNIALNDRTPAHLTHAAWNQGVNFADMVFPWFLLIVGVAIPYASESHFKKGFSRWNYILKAFGRLVTLFLLGCLIDSSIVRQPVIGLGVLQLIGLSYFMATFLYWLPGVWRVVTVIVFLVGHWALIRFYPVPGMEPGIFTEEHNVIAYINQIYLQPLHLKGLISVVPASAMVLIGTITGNILQSKVMSQKVKFAYMFTLSVGAGLSGWLWSLDLPFNKPVWTASYILYTAGWGIMVLGLLYLVIDIIGWQKWSFPLVVFGVNAILAYVLPIMVKLHIFQEWIWGANMSVIQVYLQFCIDRWGPVMGGWVYTISYIMFWWVVLFYFYKKKIFLRA